MSETHARPPRKRRRWLIVALLFVLATGVAWREWPRGDARFVGTWRVFEETTDRGVAIFHANGTLSSMAFMLKPRTWNYAGSTLQLGGPLSRLPHSFQDWWFWFFDRMGVRRNYGAWEVRDYEVIQVTDSRIVIRYRPDSGGETLVLTRVLE